MPKRVTSITELSIRNAKPREKKYFLFDGKGLYIEITPLGGKFWRFKYWMDGKGGVLSLGAYPEVSLRDARQKAHEYRCQVSKGINPTLNRQAMKLAKEEKNANTFEVIAREWHATMVVPVRVASHAAKILARLEKDVFPWIGERPVAEITPSEVLGVINRIVERGVIESAHRILQHCSAIFRFAVGTARVASDPCRDLRGQVRGKPPVKHRPALATPDALRPLLVAIDSYRGQSLIVRAALKLAPLLPVRPGELRKAEWKDFDLDAAECRFQITKKTINPVLTVPLSRQAVSILRELHAITGEDRYVFPGARKNDRPMSNNAILAALRSMGFGSEEMCGHGFRAIFRTIGDEILKFRVDLLEHQLGHAVRDPLGRAYNRTTYLAERKVMMQGWADYLDQLKAGETMFIGIQAA